MSETEKSTSLRAWLAKGLRRSSVPDWLWTDLEDAGLLNGPDTPEWRAQLVRESRRRLRRIRMDRHQPGRTSPSKAPNVARLLTEAEERRARAFSNYIGTLAAQDPDLRRFRSRNLDGRVITRAEAVQLLRSEAPRYMRVEQFRSLGVPLVGHTVSDFDYRTGSIPPMELPPQRGLYGFRHEYQMTLTWSDGSQPASGRCDYWGDWSIDKEQPEMLLTGDGERWVPVRVWKNSFFGELREVSTRLTRAYPWNEPEAILFVLTGEVPFIPPLYAPPASPKLGGYFHVRFEISVEPWVSARTVTRLYRHLQKLSLPGRSRSLSQKNLALFEFVNEHLQPGGDVLSYEKLMRLWNRHHPRDQYTSTWRFARDYRRAGNAIVFPPYKMIPGRTVRRS